nr:type II toxin-antitoxin system death-on-curing family toxin [uncultured Cohaesibacter sp.]
MTDPKWVSEELVARLHERVIDIGGGAQGIRDKGLLNSALARPQNLYAYGEEDCFQLAASYAEGIARNHPFIDGNKRTAFQTADLFLALNGYDLDAARGVEHADMMEQLGQGLISRDEAATHFQAYCQKVES